MEPFQSYFVLFKFGKSFMFILIHQTIEDHFGHNGTLETSNPHTPGPLNSGTMGILLSSPPPHPSYRYINLRCDIPQFHVIWSCFDFYMKLCNKIRYKENMLLPAHCAKTIC